MAEDGVATVADLLLRLPFRYEDRSRFEQIARLRVGETAVVSGRVLDSRLIRTRRRGFTILEAAVDDGTGSLRAVWYNRPYLARALTPGRRAILYGAAEAERGGLVFKNPEHELFDADEEGDPVHVGRVVGIYRRTGGLSGKWQRKTVAAALGALAREFASATGAANLRAALQEAHFPSGPDPEAAAEAARRELAREELLVFAAEIEARRARRRAAAVQPWRAGPTEIAAAASHLPFRLTGAQERALAEIAADLSSGHRMARLLQGDVGSGKTAVAFAAAVLAAENGRQAALMAPTEILAEQHAEKMAGWVARSGHRIGLLTGRTSATARR
jgi:ATP-dependent DNA helicase RecG